MAATIRKTITGPTRRERIRASTWTLCLLLDEDSALLGLLVSPPTSSSRSSIRRWGRVAGRGLANVGQDSLAFVRAELRAGFSVAGGNPTSNGQDYRHENTESDQYAERRNEIHPHPDVDGGTASGGEARRSSRSSPNGTSPIAASTLGGAASRTPQGSAIASHT
jgi:hypothetical protein